MTTVTDSLPRSIERLRSAGAGPGRRVGLLVEPDPGGATLILAAARLGGTVSVLNPKWTGPELARILEMLVPDLVVAGPGVVLPDGFRGGFPGDVPLERWSHPARAHVADPGIWGWGLSAPDHGAGSSTAGPEWIVWTSGSSGSPRGIVISHQAFRTSSTAVGARLGLRKGDTWIASLLPAHVGGLALILRAGFRDDSLLLPGTFDPERFNRLVDRESATHASLVPTQLAAALDQRRDRPFPSSFRTLLLGGAATPPSLLDRAIAVEVPVSLTYGMTETASQVATAPPDLVRRKPGWVGPPLDGVEVRAGSEEEGPAEIRVRGPVLARGSFQGPGGTPAALVDADGWYATGDLGVLDEEGHLRVTGRLSERIISGGVNVDPTEVEDVLGAHPEVREVVVLGISDDRWGERVVAVVVPRRPEMPPTLDRLLDYARTRLSSAKRPRQLILRDRMPRTPTGKLDRKRVALETGSPRPDASSPYGSDPTAPFLGSSES